MPELVKKEIRGITGRLLISALVGYTTIMISVVGMYFTTKNNFQKLGDKIETTAMQEEYRNNWITKEIEQSDVRYEALKNQVNIQKIEIEIIKERLKIK